MEIPKPVITDENGVYKLTYDLAVDSNKDGQKAVSASLVVTIDKKEVAEEALNVILAKSNIPDWLKKALGLM